VPTRPADGGDVRGLDRCRGSTPDAQAESDASQRE
jgi:hypothetical protein